MSTKISIVQQLGWKTRKSDGVIHADPYGMRWSYYIKPNDTDKNNFELAYVEHNGNFQEHGKLFDCITDAKLVAQQHYEDIILKNTIK